LCVCSLFYTILILTKTNKSEIKKIALIRNKSKQNHVFDTEKVEEDRRGFQDYLLPSNFV